MMNSLEELLGVDTVPHDAASKDEKGNSKKRGDKAMAFSFIFFSDVVKNISNKDKYDFMGDVTKFADKEGFEAVYLPERHFSEFGAIYANSAIVSSYLISQTSRIRFRTAGISLPLHHPTEVVENWAMNDILSGGRVDLGFGSGWNKQDFILAPDNYEDRRAICGERIEIVKKLWRGEQVAFTGPDGEEFPIQVYPRPVQKELNVWLLVAQNDQAFKFAGTQGYNVFTMLYGIDMEAMEKKINLYRQGREEAGLDPNGGTVSLMLHTHINKDRATVESLVEAPFKEYISSTINAHVRAGLGKDKGVEEVAQAEKDKMLEYAYQRYFKTCALFGSVEDGQSMVDQAIAAGVDEIVSLVDFGVNYASVMDSLPYLKQLTSLYSQAR